MSSQPARSPACDPSCADPQHLLEHHSAGALQLGIQSFISRSTCRSIVSAGELTWILPFQLKLVSWSFRKSKFMICVCLALLPVAAAFRVAEDAHVRGAEWMSKLEVKHVEISPNLTSALPANWSSRFQIAGELGEGGYGKIFKVKVTCAGGEHFVSAKYIPRMKEWSRNELVMQMNHEVLEVAGLEGNLTDYVVHAVGNPTSVESPEVLDPKAHPGVKAGRWIMMELLNGGSFRDLLKKCSESSKCNCVASKGRACWEALPGMSLPYVLALFEEALEGLEAIHSYHLAHMDIKPDNLMLQCQGKRCYSKVIDLGSLCNRSFCNTRKVAGTRVYLAPEVVGGIVDG